MALSQEQDQHGLLRVFDLAPLRQQGLDAWLSATLEECSRWFEASGGSVFLVDPDGEIRLKCKTGRQVRIPDGAVIQLGQGVAGAVLQEGSPRLLGELASEPDLVDKGIASRKDVASSMVVPIVCPEEGVVGVINLSRTSREDPFDEGDLRDATTLGTHVGLAVGNARLVSRLSDSLKEQELQLAKLEAVLASVAGEVLVYTTDRRFEPTPRCNAFVRAALEGIAEAVVVSERPLQQKVADQLLDQTWLIDAVPLPRGGAVVTVRDVTDFQRAQDEAARLRRLAEIGQLTAAVAHEVRNPLTGIRGAAQLMSDDPSTSAEMLRIIEDETVKLEDLCNDFLEFARPLKLRLQDGRLGEAAHRVVEFWRPEFERVNVGLRLETSDDEPTIPFDVRRIEQVLHNLVRNALQACGQGGEVVVQTFEGGIAVEDTGTGMDQETRERLFSPFFTTKSDGTGLGLCNLRRIVDAHGGTIEVWSEPGRGTRFEIGLRRKAA